MINNDVIINTLINDIKVHGSVLILGAGASFEMGLPLYAQFSPIVWQVVDEFAEIKTILKCDTNMNAKDIIGTDVKKIKQVFAVIESNDLASIRFKQLFKNINDSHKNGRSVVHETICRLIHSGFIKMVVSFNWDDLLETAWSNLYGTNINDSKINLLKPHGDIRNIEGKWIYPNSPGFLSDNDIAQVKSILKNGPSTFMILGYSEQDKIIADTFIKPNESKYIIYRIAPSVNGHNAISMIASEAMNKIGANLNIQENNLWNHVDFTNQVGLERAIMGCRLLSTDVIACPKLPQFNEAQIRLEQSHSVIIEGAPGSGKSITAYQLAWSYLKKGWEVLKLNVPESEKNNVELYNNGYKTIFIIDDAQQMYREKIIELLSKANKNSKLIITQTITSNFPTESVTISQEQAVSALYEHYKNHKDEVMPILRATNKSTSRSIGDNPGDTPFQFILDTAHKEKTAWLFNYSLRGGWQNTTNQYAMSKEHDRADLLLVFIALKQIFLLDKPVDDYWLNLVLKEWGYDDQWIGNQLDYLYKQKLILSKIEVRTLHLEMAIRVIVNFIKQMEDDESLKFQSIFQRELLSIDNPILGIVWFFNMMFSFDIKYKFTYNLFSEEFKEKLLERCKKQTESKNKSHAGFVIDRVLHLEAHMKYKDIVEEDNFLSNWIENVDNQTAYSFSGILNSMINESHDWQKDFVSHLNSQAIIENLRNIETDYLYDWASFLNRLTFAHKSKWSKSFYAQFPQNEISEAMQKATIKDIGGLTEMLCTLRFINEEFCYNEYYRCIEIIKKSMKQDFMRTLRNIDLHFLMYILGENLFDLGRRNQMQKNAGTAFVNCITSEMIYKCIFEGTPQDWDTFYRFSGEIFRYNPQKFITAIEDADFNVLDDVTSEIWSSSQDVLIKLLYMLYPCNEKKTESWIYSNRGKIKDISTALIQFSPRTAEYIYNNKGSILLSSFRWGVNANAIASMKSYNKDLCIKIIDGKLAEIKQSLYDLSKNDLEDYYIFLEQVLAVQRNLIDAIIYDEDVSLLEDKWEDIMRNQYYKHDKKELQGFKKLINIIKNNTNNQFLIAKMESLNKKIDNVLNNLRTFKR